jgi:hypothetical protein
MDATSVVAAIKRDGLAASIHLAMLFAVLNGFE